MRDMVTKGATEVEMSTYAESIGYRNLYQDGLVKASRGETSLDELLRVLSSDSGP